MNRYWLSWNEYEKDYRPLTDPPVAGVLGWWCSGCAGDETYSTLCAWVEAPSEGAAWELLAKSWPQEDDFDVRFENQVENNWRPSDRFPLAPWTKARIAPTPGTRDE